MNIWYMDSELCECGGVLDDFGVCEACGSDGDYDDYEDETIFPEDEAYYMFLAGASL